MGRMGFAPLGAIDMLAFLAAIMPRRWMEAANILSGLGELPPGPLVGYLARSASALYGLHGAMIFFISLMSYRYWRLITFLAVAPSFTGSSCSASTCMKACPGGGQIFEPPGFASNRRYRVDTARLEQQDEVRMTRSGLAHWRGACGWLRRMSTRTAGQVPHAMRCFRNAVPGF